MADSNLPYPGASRREQRHSQREADNPRGAIRDRGRGRQIAIENEARNTENANARGRSRRRGG